MKKILTLLVIVIFVLSGLGAVAGTEEKIEITEYSKSETLMISTPIIIDKENYVSVEVLEETSKSWEEDKPILPVVNKVYKFPFGTIIGNVEVTFSDPIEMEILKPIQPSSELQTFSIYTSHEIVESEIIMSYSDIEIYPNEKYGYRVGTGLDGNDRVVYLSIQISPVQYNPKLSTIYYSDIAEINIDYTSPDNPITFPVEYDLLIITPAQFESALQRLVDHKNQIGVNTTMVTLDDIPSGVGVDEQEDIKLFIKDAIETMGITYLILVGAGVEGEELFPVRYAWISSSTLEDKFPSDLYYADIYNATSGFSNWDYDGDGRFAEYPVDLPNVDAIPDLRLGKLPCNNVAEINTVIDKIIDYKEHNKMLNKILQLGADSLPGDSVYEGEYANEKVLERLPGYTPTRLWGTNGQLTKLNIAKGFKSGVDFVDISGHGSYLSWATHPPDDETVWIPPETLISPYTGFLYFEYDLYNINNGKKLPVVVFTACSNNKYTKSSNCIGWKTVSKDDGGGIACFAESGIGHGPGGADFVNYNIGWMEVEIFDQLHNTKELGQSWVNAITNYYNHFDPGLDKADYKTMLEFSMFGDPTTIIQDGDDPKSKPAYRPIISGILERLLDYFPILHQLLQKLGL
jgi:hypothetical protein